MSNRTWIISDALDDVSDISDGDIPDVPEKEIDVDIELIDAKQGGLSPVWPDLAKFRHFGNILKVLGNFWGFIYYLAKFWTFFGKIRIPLGKFSLI